MSYEIMDEKTLAEIHAKLDTLAVKLSGDEFHVHNKSRTHDVFAFIAGKVSEFVRLYQGQNFGEKTYQLKLFNTIMQEFCEYLTKKMEEHDKNWLERNRELYTPHLTAAHDKFHSVRFQVGEYIRQYILQAMVSLMNTL